MTIESIFASLAGAAHKSYTNKKLASEIRQIMSKLGEQQFANALVALDDALSSSNPRHELTSAINHLQDAASAFKEAFDKASGKKLDNRGDYKHARYPFGRGMCEALGLITVIYAGLGEKKLALKYAGKLRDEAWRAYPQIMFVEVKAKKWDSDFSGYLGKTRAVEIWDFYDKVNSLLKAVGSKPCPTWLEIGVRRYTSTFSSESWSGVSYEKVEISASGKSDALQRYKKVPRERMGHMNNDLFFTRYEDGSRASPPS